MRWFVIFAGIALAPAGASVADETVIVTGSDSGRNRATIIQTGPTDDEPVVETRRGRGYVVIKQHSRHNRAEIIQADPQN